MAWPPTAGTYPAWPPPEFLADSMACSGLYALLIELRRFKFTRQNPTTLENQTFFSGNTCNEGHSITGTMLVSADGTRRYPFAICRNAAHRQLLCLWPPYFMGVRSGEDVYR